MFSHCFIQPCVALLQNMSGYCYKECALLFHIYSICNLILLERNLCKYLLIIYRIIAPSNSSLTTTFLHTKKKWLFRQFKEANIYLLTTSRVWYTKGSLRITGGPTLKICPVQTLSKKFLKFIMWEVLAFTIYWCSTILHKTSLARMPLNN